MQEHVTLLGPVGSPRERKSLSSTLPPDLMEQVRGRVRLLALLILIAFSFDPLVYFGICFIATVAGFPVIYEQLGFRLLDTSAPLTRKAGSNGVPESKHRAVEPEIHREGRRSSHRDQFRIRSAVLARRVHVSYCGRLPPE